MRTSRDQPFFLYLAHMYVHLPLYVEDRFTESSTNGRYGAAVAALDWPTGVVLRELSALGLDESTLVFFTRDNGPLAGDGGGRQPPLRGTTGTPREGGTGVPRNRTAK